MTGLAFQGNDLLIGRNPFYSNTAPSMHDGSVPTLLDVIEWYAHEGRKNRNLDDRFRRIPGGILTTEDKHDLVAFIEACSGPLPVVETGRLPLDPQHLSRRTQGDRPLPLASPAPSP